MVVFYRPGPGGVITARVEGSEDARKEPDTLGAPAPLFPPGYDEDLARRLREEEERGAGPEPEAHGSPGAIVVPVGTEPPPGVPPDWAPPWGIERGQRIIAPMGFRSGAVHYPGSGVPGNPLVVAHAPEVRGLPSRVRPWHAATHPEYEARSGIQHGFPTLLVRAPSLNAAHVNYRTALSAAHAGNHLRSPTTLRMEGFGYQRPTGEYAYTMRPNRGRYEGGTAPGGLWLMQPEVSIDDHATSFAPAGRTKSTVYFGFAPEVRLAWGIPVPSNGGMKSGHYAALDTAGSLSLKQVDASGVATTAFAVDSSARPSLRETGGAMLKVGAVGDGQLLQRSGTDLVGVTPGLSVGQDTGWTAMAGTATKGGFDTATVTLSQLAQVVKAMLDAHLSGDLETA